MKKRAISILLAGTMVLSLAACGSQSANTGNDTSAAASEAVSEAAPEDTAPDSAAPEDGAPEDGAPEGEGGPGGPGGPGEMNKEPVEGQLGSWNGGGLDASTIGGNDYDYDAALYITADGISEEDSATDRISGGSYDAAAADGITIEDSESGNNGVIVVDAEYTIKNSVFDFLTDADGTDTCDFSGKGTVLAAFGENAKLTVEDTKIHTSGVATMPVFADSGSVVSLHNVTLQSDGGTLYQEYLNTPDQQLMVAPPWILGIMGTSRGSNMEGDDTTTNVVDSTTSAGAWAVLSTDSGSNMYLNVYNSSLTLNNKDESAAAALQAEGGQITQTLDNPYTKNYGSGYGTYTIGNAVETFAGAELNVGTYANIFTGGTATYTDLKAGESYDLKNSAGEVTETYEAKEDKNTVIKSDTFGFMFHQGENNLTVENGTEVNSEYATFLVKSGASNETMTAAIDNAAIKNGGVLIQVMDNDDATTGGMMDADDPANTNGGMMNFKPVHEESAGFTTDAANAGEATQNFAFTNGTYAGNIYNASGSDGLDGNALNVTFGKGAVYSGAAAYTSAIHISYDGETALKAASCMAFENADEAAAFAGKYQLTSFTIDEYFNMGHVANMICDNGGNAVNITLEDDAVWNVTAASAITSLTISGDAQVVIPADVTLTVNGTDYTGTTLKAGDL